MTESEATREMTFAEEYEILKSEKDELFATESNDSEPQFANCVVRRALRCIRKLKEEREQYRAIGTVSEFRELKEKATAKRKCPNCNEVLSDEYRFCPTCRRKVDLSEGKE